MPQEPAKVSWLIFRGAALVLHKHPRQSLELEGNQYNQGYQQRL